MRKLLRKYAVVPERLVTDDLRSYGAATLDLGIDHLHDRRDGVESTTGAVAVGTEEWPAAFAHCRCLNSDRS
jgi:hypothetical protein